VGGLKVGSPTISGQKLQTHTAKYTRVSPSTAEHADYLPAVLDLTSGSGRLTIACAEAGYSFIAVKLDEKQAQASAVEIKKFFQKDGGTFRFLEEDKGSDENPTRNLQDAFADVVESDSN
jgi:predicted RNA methylase